MVICIELFLELFHLLLSDTCSLHQCNISDEGVSMLAGVLEINISLQWVQPFLSYFLRGVYRADDVALLPDVNIP